MKTSSLGACKRPMIVACHNEGTSRATKGEGVRISGLDSTRGFAGLTNDCKNFVN